MTQLPDDGEVLLIRHRRRHLSGNLLADVNQSSDASTLFISSHDRLKAHKIFIFRRFFLLEFYSNLNFSSKTLLGLLVIQKITFLLTFRNINFEREFYLKCRRIKTLKIIIY